MLENNPIVPTEEQQAVVAAARGGESLMIKAYAGAAKTTTLTMLAKEIRSPGIALAFNAAIARELNGRFPSWFKTQTMNGLGLGAWMRSRPGMTLAEPDKRKLGKLITEIAKEWHTVLVDDQWGDCQKLVTRAMQAGLSLGDEGSPLISDTDEAWKGLAADLWIGDDDFDVIYPLAREVLRRSVAMAKSGVLSFDDQVYCPTILGGAFPKYPVVLVDEAQDLSPLNHRMLRLTMKADAKLVAVGDPLQAIYAFRGADADSMDKISNLRDSWLVRPLATTFRCPKIVVARQQRHAPGFKAWHANAEGCFARFRPMVWGVDGAASGGWNWTDLEGAKPQPSATVAVLCRNNAPLLGLAMKLIRAGIGPVMNGRDIGKNLITLSRKICSDDDQSKDSFLELLEEWKNKETATLSSGGKDDQIASVVDRSECLKVVAEQVRDVGELRKLLERIFSREGGAVLLSTIHRAKGLEWDVVLHLDPWRVPSKSALEAAEFGDKIPLRQEMNLLYVCETRAKHTLLNADYKDWKIA